MKQYLEGLKNILTNGRWSSNRTSKKTIKVWGGNQRYDLSKGVPLVTTRQTYFKHAIVELCWFLQGLTNNDYLASYGCKFWTEWQVLEEHVNRIVPLNDERVSSIYGTKITDLRISDVITSNEAAEARKFINNNDHLGFKDFIVRNFLEDNISILAYKDIGFKVGDLGPIYGKMWREWPTSNGETIDQIAVVEHQLRSNPNSRRIIVSGWNPELLPDESISPQDNVLNGKQALAPCHTLFQFGTEELNYEERVALLRANDELLRQYTLWATNEDGHGVGMDGTMTKFTELGIPKYRLNCKLYCRSQDNTLGTPVNIFSYAMMTYMLCHVHNMVPGYYEHSSGDSHLYSDQIEGVNLQLTREPLETTAKVIFKRKPNSITEFTPEDIEVIDYFHCGAIKHERPAI